MNNKIYLRPVLGKLIKTALNSAISGQQARNAYLQDEIKQIEEDRARAEEAANGVIGLARERFTKNLWTDRASNERPCLVTVRDEADQARFVADAVLENRETGMRLKDQAVLFRASHHSGPLEVELTRRNIPFVKFGGLKFLDSAHVKDMLAALRFAQNMRDRVAGFRLMQLLPGVGPASAQNALDAIADRLSSSGGLSVDDALVADVAKAKAAAYENYPKAFGPYASFPVQMRNAMPRDAVWVRDITLNNSTWGNRTFPLYNPRDNVYPIGAAIGPGMQLGIGAALGAKGRKVVCMCGDGGFFLNLTELWTAVQEQIDIVFVVMNDKGYGVIKHIQSTLYGGRHFFGDLLGPDLEKLCEIAGMNYVRVDKEDGLEGAVSGALDVVGPSIVEVDMKAIGDFPQYFKPPPYADSDEDE